MKKFLLTLMLCLMTMAVQSQIQRKFFGLELGKSTYQEVKDFVKKEKWLIIVQNDDHIYVNSKKTKHLILFGGVSWDDVRLYFNNGLLYQISFSYDSLNHYLETESESLLEFNDLKRRIKDKYHSYLEKENKREGDSSTDEIFYRDGNTLLQITNSSIRLHLTYKDDTKSVDRIKKENDEL